MDLSSVVPEPSSHSLRPLANPSDVTALVRLIARVNRSLDLDQVLHSALEGILQIVSSDFGCFLLVQPGAPSLWIAQPRGLSSALLERLRLVTLSPETRAEVMQQHAASRVILEIGQHARAALLAEGVRQFVLIPLTALGRAVGVLVAGMNARAPVPPTSVDLLMTLGEQIGMSIENARLHASVKESEEWHRAFIENSPDAFIEGDFESRLLFVNDAACRVFEMDRETLLRSRLDELVVDPEEYRRASTEMLQRDGFLLNRLGQVRTGTGNIKALSYSARLVRNSRNQVVGYQAIFRDVTREHQALQMLHRRTEELTALNAIASILNHPLEIEHLLNQVCEQITAITDMDTAAIHLLDSSAQHLVLLAHSGVSDTLLPQIQRTGVNDRFVHAIAIEGRALALSDVMMHDGNELAGPRSEGYHAGIGVPIFRRGVPIGTIFVGSKRKATYEQRDVELLQNIGNQVGVALDNADLYEKMRQRIGELDGLARLSAACTSSLDPYTISTLAVEWTQKLLRVPACNVRLIEDGRLRLYAVRGEQPDAELPPVIEISPLSRSIIERRIPHAIADLASDPSLSAWGRQVAQAHGVCASVAAPLVPRDQVIGILRAADHKPRQWTANELDLLQTISNQVASALDNARLFQNVLSEQRKTQAIFDSSISGLFVTDAQGRIVMLNRAAARITGWTLEEVQGKLWTEVFGEATPHAPQPLLDEALGRKQPAYVPSGRTMRTRDGRVIPIAQAVAPLLDANEQVTGAVCAFWDRSREQAAELTREWFLTLVAHELRSPLTSLLSALQLLERRSLPREERAELWGIIKGEGERLRKFANQFLDAESARSFNTVEFEPLQVSTLARRLVKRFRANTTRHQFRVRAPSPEPMAYADPDRVEVTLRNLLDNAIHYSPEGRITVSVQSLDDGMVRVGVEDQGPGIPFEAKDKIFDPFFRPSREQGYRVYGHGVGLSIARALVKDMGGTIWVESERGRGTTFYFTLRGAR